MEYHKERYTDHSLVILKDNRLLALLPAHHENGVLYSHRGLSYGGLIVKKSLKFELFVECFSLVLDYLAENGFKQFNLKKIPSIYNLQPGDEIDYLMFILKADLLKREGLSVLDLHNEYKINRNRLEGKKRGQKNKLVVRHEHKFEAFWNQLLIPNLRSKHNTKPVHSAEEIMLLAKKFPKKIRQFNVYKDEILVAGTTLFVTKQVAHVQYISGNADNNKLGSLDFLFCHLIEEEFKNKRYFDFGSSNENNGLNINSGLLYWKEGFGARTVTQDFYNIDLGNRKLLNSIFI